MTTIRNWTATSTAQNPTAFITKGKQRIKQHNGLVYLKDNQEFEIELFNPRINSVLAKIKLNGKYIQGGGIVLRPGERVFLERHLDQNRKFVFSTYEVGKSTEVEKAISNNGTVEIEFYDEYINYDNYIITDVTWNPGFNPNAYPYAGDVFYTSSGTANVTFGDSMNTTLTSIVGATMDSMPMDALSGALGKKSNKKETGTVEKGDTSKQKLVTVDKEFHDISMHNVLWKILPESEKVYTSKTINKAYCTECGSRIKKSTFKFCPNCGTQI